MDPFVGRNDLRHDIVRTANLSLLRIANFVLPTGNNRVRSQNETLFDRALSELKAKLSPNMIQQARPGILARGFNLTSVNPP
jgi:hypothetical protein